MKNVKNRSAAAKLIFNVLESLPDGKMIGFFKYKNDDAPIMIDNKLVMIVARASLVEKNISIIEGIDTVPIPVIMRLAESLKEKGIKVHVIEDILEKLKPEKEIVPMIMPKKDKVVPGIDEIIKKDISANIIIPDFIPVVYDPSRRGNRKPWFHYR